MWQGGCAIAVAAAVNQITVICLGLFFGTPGLIWNAVPGPQGALQTETCAPRWPAPRRVPIFEWPKSKISKPDRANGN